MADVAETMGELVSKDEGEVAWYPFNPVSNHYFTYLTGELHWGVSSVGTITLGSPIVDVQRGAENAPGGEGESKSGLEHGGVA